MPEISEEELTKFKDDAAAKERLETSNKRLEGENTKYKTRAQDAESKVADAEKATLESQGKTQELLDIEKAARLKVEDKYKNRTKDVLREKMRNEAGKFAKGVHDVDMLLNISEHKDLLKTDEETLTITGMEDYVAKCRETHAFMFSKKSMGDTDNTKPGKGGDEEFKSDDEKYRAELKGCTTKLELDKIKRKYNKPIEY